MNAFSPSYVSQIKTDDISSCLKKSRASTAKRGELREHETLSIRENAAGSIKVKQHAGQWPKGKPLVQPPINSQAKLQSDAPGKQAKLSRGRAI